MVRRCLSIGLMVAAGFFAGVSCSHNEKKADSAVQTDQQKNDNEFTIDKGVVNFKADIVYFKYDDSSLTEEGMARLNALADYLKKNEGKKLTIEGHTDARGSVKYNEALGGRRSESVKKYLEEVGVKGDRLDTASFGKKRPAVQGDSEEAWAKNRRVEFRIISDSASHSEKTTE
ncbi:MAG: OmpA family protein [Oligoflexales bacterium]|nr:OmpA family protein [Oligoflexales bacterium]